LDYLFFVNFFDIDHIPYQVGEICCLKN
jgi:hypothetical protein